MKKKIILGITFIILLCVIVLVYVKVNNKDENIVKDSIKFKEEYEKLNDTVKPKVSLNDDNPFVYADSKKVIETLKSGTGLIYFGFSNCPWCRNAVNVLQYVNTDEILYFDVKDKRDTYEVIDGVLKKTKDAEDGYYEILELLDDILEDYEIEDDSTTYKVGEKRIYVPLVVGVLNGKIVGYHLDTVDLNEGQSAYDLLDENQKSKLKLIYDEINSKVNSSSCDVNSKHGC